MTSRRAAERKDAGEPRATAALDVRAGLLLGLGLATLLSYGFLWLQPLWLWDLEPFLFEARPVHFILGLNSGGIAAFIAAFVLPCVLYVVALLVLPAVPVRFARGVAVCVAIAAPALLIGAYPALAADIFDYLMIGRLLAEHGLNPYIYVANDVPYDVYYLPVGWKDLPSVYGPLWVLILGPVAGAAGDSPTSALVLVKGIAIAAHFGVAALVYLTARTLAPERAVFAFLAYAWNPLVIVHTAVDGHNDSVMLLFVMAAVYLGLGRRWEIALPLLALGALVKFVPLALLPLFLWQARRDRRTLAFGLAVSGLLAAVAFAPLWAGIATFDGVRDQASRMTSSPLALVSLYAPDSLARVLGLGLFGLGYAAVLRAEKDLVLGSYLVLVLYLVALSGWTKPWYFSWMVALGAVQGGAAFWVTIPAMAGAFSSYLVGGWGWWMNWLDWQERWGQRGMELALTASTYGGLLLAGAAVLARRALGRGRDVGRRPAGRTGLRARRA